MLKIISKCKKTRARSSILNLSSPVSLPAFMPVATYAAMKACPFEKIKAELILSNTYHCRNLNNIKDFTKWKRNLLTDSGGFQIGSLKDAIVKEEGVYFDGVLFTPEESMLTQIKLGADIIMQLDDVVPPTSSRIEEAMDRSIRWLDRCIKTLDENKSSNKQYLFPIIQGGTNLELRTISINEILKRNPEGIAIGGLCGGESKLNFAKTIFHCTSLIKKEVPVYVMGVGYPEDVVISVALGCDMMDCVYPTRTARFGKMLTDEGDLSLQKENRKSDENYENSKRSKLAISKLSSITKCFCDTCSNYTFEYLRSIKGTTNFSILLTAHNLNYMHELGKRMRNAIENETFDAFVVGYMKRRYKEVPGWIKEALSWVDIIVE